ncbi:MAG: RnfABCDGE type electron transport complex subunit A [Bacilli bacterium]|jgi:electron transport complex protein RnfA|nr:RnfABCDGE type electron transport complex subunit A [Bacilli bacterium]
MQLFFIFFAAVFVNNIILTQFLGICSFLGVTNKRSQALGMGAAVIFVIFTSCILSYLMHKYILIPFNVDYLQTILFILIIASLVQFVEIVMKKYSPTLYRAMGIYLPLITTNCAVLGACNNIITKGYNTIWETAIYGIGISLGYALVMFIFSTIREKVDYNPTPMPWKGNPIGLVCAASMALAFFGLGGLV